MRHDDNTDTRDKERTESLQEVPLVLMANAPIHMIIPITMRKPKVNLNDVINRCMCHGVS
jgi:hypothetical protein